MTFTGDRLEPLKSVLERYCLSLTKSCWDAEDLAQDTWLKVLRTPKDFQHNNPEALLLRIARNTWIDRTRRKVVELRARSAELQNREATLSTDRHAHEIEPELRALMQHLTPLQLTTFVLRDVLGYSIAETAEALGLSEGAVKAARYRARQSLHTVKEELEQDQKQVPEHKQKQKLLPDQKQKQYQKQKQKQGHEHEYEQGMDDRQAMKPDFAEHSYQEVLHAFVQAYERGNIVPLVKLAQWNAARQAIRPVVMRTSIAVHRQQAPRMAA
ncbi:RNA polymerase sigma factor [Paenibacillaceae bacterium]|nr:RNA polymerase sigma factor [Paenibacillaceae bacterium]